MVPLQLWQFLLLRLELELLRNKPSIETANVQPVLHSYWPTEISEQSNSNKEKTVKSSHGGYGSPPGRTTVQ